MLGVALAHSAGTALLGAVLAVFAVLACITWVAARAGGRIRDAAGNGPQKR